MENSPELKALIRKNASLFWYTKEGEKENLPLQVVVEFFLNYANEEDLQELFRIAGIKKVAAIFREQIAKSERAANNILPINRNYFTLYFNKYA